MVEISRHRDTTHPRWRMLFTVVVLLSGLVRHCEPMSVKRLTDNSSSPPPPPPPPPSPAPSSSFSSLTPSSSSSSSSSATLSRSSVESRSQNLGSPSDLAWQAWLLLDSQMGAHSGLDSASFLRRITPKSVFIAPALPALPPCADGYRADTMGRCVKNVDIDHEAHLGFLLQRLNNRYNNRGGGVAHAEAQVSTGNNQKKSSGPFQLNIPLLSSSDHDASLQQNHEETGDSIVIPIVVPARRDAIAKEEDNNKPQPAHPLLITLYETKNGSKGEKADETDLFSGNASLASSANKTDQAGPKLDTVVVPVAEFVDDANDANFSGVVDYKIPIDLRTILNMSNIRTINTSDEQDAWKNGSQFANSTEPSPMLILLSSMPPNFAVPGDSQANGTHDRSVVRLGNLTKNPTDKESIGAGVSESGSPSKELDLPPTVVERTESLSTTARGESQEVESFYDDEGEEEMEDYVDSTDVPEEEESSEAEGGEILKHGEAGMAIPVKDIERLQLDTEERRRMRNETLKIDRNDEISIRFNDSANLEKEERDESSGNVSSEVSIKGDIILETTLLDVTTDRTRNLTEVSSQTGKSSSKHHPEETSDEDLRELFEAHDDSVSTGTEPEVVSVSENDRDDTPSPAQSGETSTITSRSQDKEDTDAAKSEELVAAPSSSETLLYDPDTRDRYTEEDPIDGIHTIDEDAANSKATAFFPKKSKGSDQFHTFEPGTLNFRPTLDYDRQHPYPRQPVRFPSEEVNSIHGQSYKEGIPYPLDDGLHSSTKSSVFGHQKPYHRGVSLWRPYARPQQQDATTGEQQQRAEATITGHRQRLSPLSVSFWTAMPLMRDPGLYSADQDKNGGQRRSYADNRYPSVSPS